jgi:hypothetical protein
MENIINFLANKTQQQDLFLDTIADKFPMYDFSQFSEIVNLNLKNLNMKSLHYLKAALRDMSIGDWFNEEKIDYIPSRFKIILFLLIMKVDPKDADDILRSSGHYGLNPRSVVDATVIFALLHKQDLDLWFENYMFLEKEFQNALNLNHTLSTDSDTVSLESIREFIRSQREPSNGKLITKKITRIVQENLEKASTNDDLTKFFENNLEYITEYRVKSRYRLLIAIEEYMTRQIIDFTTQYNQFAATKSNLDWKQLKKVQKESVLMGNINEKGIFGEIIKTKSSVNSVLTPDSFNDIRLSLNRFLKKYSDFYCQSNFFNSDTIEDDDGISLKPYSDSKESDDTESIGQASISKVTINAFRDVLFGKKDPSRKLLITLLLFTGVQNIGRLNIILTDCGFDLINENRAFDMFITNFLSVENKQDYLFQLASELAIQKRSFFLDNIERMVELPAKELKNKININKRII